MGLGDILKTVVTAPLKGLDAFNNFIGLPTHNSDGSVNPGVLDRPLEAVSSGLQWFRDNAISQPLSTAELVARKAEDGSVLGNWNTVFSAGEWSKAWKAAEHISPGQAFWYKRGGLSSDAATELENSPLEYATPDKAQLPPNWSQLPYAQQQSLLKEAGTPLQNKALADANRTSKFFHYASGATDFALSWELDPAILAGKAIGGLREGGIVARTGKFTKADIDNVMRSNLMTKTQQWLWANRDNPQLVNNLDLARKSGMGPKFGAILSTLQSEKEVNLFLRAGMGDQTAADYLKQTNLVADAHMQSAQTRLSLLGQDLSAAATDSERQIIQAQMDSANKAIAADQATVSRYGQILDSMHELDQLNLSKWSFARAEDRTAAQNAYRTGAGANFAPVSGRSLTRLPQRAPNLSHQPVIGSRPIDILPKVGISRIYTDFWGLPVTVARAFGNFRPSGHIDIQGISQDSINELRGYLARIPNISDQNRAGMLNDYLRAPTEMDRKNLLLGFEKTAVANVAQKHGFTADDGLGVYAKHQIKQGQEVERMIQYTTAHMADETGQDIRADFFHDQSGAVKVAPNMVARLVNDHIMMDLDRFDTILARHGSMLHALRPAAGSLVDAMDHAGDFTSSMWKFGTLFRLGYIPRVLGDDLAGQVAALGASAMAMRAMVGVKNLATNLALWHERPFLEQRVATRQTGLDFAQKELDDLTQRGTLLQNFLRTESTQRVIQADRAQRQLAAAQAKRAALPADATAAKVAAHDAFVAQRLAAHKAAQARMNSPVSPGKMVALNTIRQRQGFLQQYIDAAQKDVAETRAKLDSPRAIQGNQPLIVNGVALPGALTGVRGEFYQKLISPDQSLENIFGTNKGMLQGLIARSFDHGAITANAVANPETHMQGWLHILNHQFAQDELGRQALAGASVEDMTKWLKTARGQLYWKRLGITNDPPEYLANSVWHDVAELAPTPGIRAAALTPEGVTKEQLEREVPKPEYRPDVHVGQTYAGKRETEATSAKVFRFWFDTVAGLPAARWSRHPLFNQLYEGHAKAIVAKEQAQGVQHTVDDANRIAETARRIAYKDMRKLVFDVTHRNDAVAALKLVSPFFAATAEGWQRWARIVASRPETVGYAAKFFNTPMALGMVQDGNGNPVDRYGYAFDPEQGKRVLVSKADRRIVTRLPGWFMKSGLGAFFGATADGRVNLSQDSMNLVLNGDPVFNPGTGPIVTIPVQEFVKDKPNLADLAQKTGILPFGVDTSSSYGSGAIGRFTGAVLPRSLKDFLTAFDTSDSRYQSVKLHIMQQAAFEHDHLGKPMPTAAQIADRVKNYWEFSALSSFLGPIANKQNDPYQWYRDQYNKLRAQNPLTADDKFLQKYGESYFLFAQAETKNQGGIVASRKAVNLSRKYADLIAQMPELASLIVGPKGNGPFDPVSYAYQLNSPLVPGSSEMQRTRLSADQAMSENQRRLGWAKYTAKMNELHAQLISAGFQNFTDPGAEQFAAQKRAWTMLYSQPLYPDGTPNPYYNKAWAADWNNYDSTKYAQLIPALTKLANSDLAKSSDRHDLQKLGEYLGARLEVSKALADRKAAGGSDVLTAQSNADLQQQWMATVGGLIESDTTFGDLYHRYLARDLGVDASPTNGGS